MPATNRGSETDQFVCGVDGCRAGWVAVRRNQARNSHELSIWPRFADLITSFGPSTAALLVDMPIGLPDQRRRACEKMARDHLKPKRHASVFPSPMRPMLAFDTYAEANRRGKNLGPGHGLPKQTWMLMPKIRELDAILKPPDQKWIGEGHPELAFCRLNQNVPCAHPKKTTEGQSERRELLLNHGINNTDDLIEKAKDLAQAQVGIDDVYDACALALAAEARLDRTALCLTDGAIDARGLKMEIWG